MISVFDIFKIGIGPSSSHTLGPMRATYDFIGRIQKYEIDKIIVRLYGSLALTGKGHGTDKAILLGLQGEQPETVIPETVPAIIHTHTLSLSS